MGRFLRAHRARVTPDEAGLVAGPDLRRTPGLRREELATLAGSASTTTPRTWSAARRTLLACNPIGLRLFAGMEKWPVKERNVVRYVP